MALPVRLAHFCLEQVPSFSAYLPYLAYEEDTQLYLVSKDADPTNLAWGVVFECLPHPGPGDKQATNLKGIFDLMWPPGSTIQISAAGLQTEVIPLLIQYRELRQGEQHLQFANRRIQRLASLLLSGNQAIQTAPLRDMVVLVSITVPISPIRRHWGQTIKNTSRTLLGHPGHSQYENLVRAVPQVNRLAADVEQLLRQASLFPRRIGPARFMSILYPILNPSHPVQTFSTYEQDRELRRQMVLADTQVIPHVDGMDIDGYAYRSISPLQLPSEFTIDQMQRMTGDLINTTQQIPTSFLLTLNAVTYDRSDASRALHRKFAVVSQQAVGPMARIIPRLGVKSQNYHVAMQALEHGHIPISAYLHLAIWAPTVGEVNHASAASEAIWRAHNFVPQRDGPASLNLFRESLPLALSSNVTYLQRDLARARTILSSNCASLSPIGGDWKGTGRPILLLVSRRGQLAGIEPYQNPGGNYNFLTAGISGGGKSVLNNDLILGLVGSGATTTIIDKGRSYEKVVTTLKGDYLVFNTESPLNLNPFSTIDTDEEFAERITGLKALVAQMASPSQPVSDLEDSHIGQAIQEAWAAHRQHTTITHIAGILAGSDDARVRDLAQMLYPYTAEGEYARFFEGPATIDVMKSKLLLLELEELSTKPKLQSVVFLALVLALRTAMEKGERRTRKCVLIDEAWELLKSKQAASCLEELFRRGRKFNMASGVVTQSLQDLVETEVGNVILNNSDLRFIFGHKGEALRDARLALTPYEQQIIRSLTMVRGRYSECYITHPSGSGVYRHIIEPVSYWLYTSNAEEVARLQALMEDEQLSMAEAIDRMVGEDTLGKTILANIAEALK